MSGLCGILRFDGAPAGQPALQRMAEAAVHRGPDGVRFWSGDGACLAHLALHVTPEDQHAQQPLTEDGLALTADARFDNRADLIRALTARGYLAQRRPADAALLLAAYRCWGTECARHLLGDFAFAIWDAPQQRLFAARDPMAMRPLYYRCEPGRFFFASEVKQILAAPGVPDRLFEPAIAAHLAGRFEPLEQTFYEGIAQLPPAHALVANAQGCRTWRYWDIDPAFRIAYGSESEYAERFLEVFEEAVRCRLRAAAPVGLMLSGGLDSTSVAATAGGLFQKGETPCPALRTYSWAYDTLPQCDERAVSDRVAEHYGLPSTAIAAEAAAPLEHYLADVPDPDEPFAGVYDVLIGRTLAAARAEGVRQMLTGHRGDLVVGEWILDYIGLLRSGRWLTLWREMHAHSRRSGAPLKRIALRYLRPPIREMLWPKGRAERLRTPLRSFYRTLRPAPPAPPPYPPWIRPTFAKRAGLDEAPAPMPVPSGLRGYARRQRYRAVLMPLHMRTATLFERCCARAGLSSADLWSDRRLVEFALAVPPRALSRAGENKRIVRLAMRGVMPERARQAAGKTSPKPLYERALKERAQKTVRRLISDPCAEALGYLDGDALRAYYEDYLRGETENHHFWYALTLEMWLRRREKARRCLPRSNGSAAPQKHTTTS